MKPPFRTESDVAIAAWRTRRMLAAVVALAVSAMALLLLRTLMIGATRVAGPNGTPAFSLQDAVLVVAPATLAAVLWAFALQGQSPVVRQLLKSSTLAGLAAGVAGFLAGFALSVAQSTGKTGPYNGFVAGSAGFVLGTVLGAVVGWVRARQTE